MLAWDTETALIGPTRLAPELACLTFSDGEKTEIIHWTDPACCRTIEWLLGGPSALANAPYDLAVVWAQFPSLRDVVWGAVAQGRVHDVQVRQKLIDIGEGCYQRYYTKLPGEEKTSLLQYSLSDLHARYYGRRMEKDEWRLKYGELRQLPLEQWPEGAVHYARYDAHITWHVFQEQQKQQPRMKRDPSCYLHDEAPQVRAAWALHLMSCWGFATDPEQAKKVMDQIDKEQPELAEQLQRVGLVRANGTRAKKLAQKMMWEAVGEAGELTKTGYKKVKDGLLTKEQALRDGGYIKVDEEWCEVSKDPNLIAYHKYSQNQLLKTKLKKFMHGLPMQTSFDVLKDTGRTSSSENKLIPNSAALQNLPRKEGLRECLVARPGCVLIASDFGQAELVSLAQVTYSAFGHSRMRDLLNADKDIHVDFGAQIMASKIHKDISYEEAWQMHKVKGGVDTRDGNLIFDKNLGDWNKQWIEQTGGSPFILMKDMRQAAKCFHPDAEVLTGTGWVKISELDPGTAVMAASFEDGGRTSLQWEVPTRLTTRKADELVHLKNKGVDLLVTPDHRMAAWNPSVPNPKGQQRDPDTGLMLSNGGKQKQTSLRHEVCTPEELGKKRAWPSAGFAEGSISLDEDMLRVAVAVQADGSYRGENKISFGFTKQRKIARMEMLLQQACIDFERREVGKNEVTTFYIRGEGNKAIRRLLDADKTLPWWWVGLSLSNRQSIVEEARYWDSHSPSKGTGYVYSSTIKKNVEVLQALSVTSGQKAHLLKTETGHAHRLSVRKGANTRGGNLETERVTWNDDVYCLTVPSDAVLIRQNGKVIVTHQCADFGIPGGLGATSFQSYARKVWGVELTEKEAKKLIKQWKKWFPEMIEYFAMISRLCEAGGGKTDVQLFGSNRWRGDCRYTQACNGYFQALTADAAKAAMWEVSLRCYTQKSSLMYGCRPVLFVHDEILMEAPEDQAPEAAKEMEKVMVETYQRFTPDVKVTADAHLMRRWSKGAEAAWDERGKLIPWDDAEAA